MSHPVYPHLQAIDEGLEKGQLIPFPNCCGTRGDEDQPLDGSINNPVFGPQFRLINSLGAQHESSHIGDCRAY